MKQIVQNYKQGRLSIEQTPSPALKAGGVLVHTYHSLISAGTEKMKVDDAKRSYIGMAKAKPDAFKQVLQTLRQQGPLATYRKVINRLDSFSPMGYSLAGKVVAVGDGETEFAIGDMVACAGAGLANHAELNWIPTNLCVKIPLKLATDNNTSQLVPTEEAAFCTVGAIAMQGVRQAEVRIGENVAVIGLGLVGLLACQILRASGCNVFGLDIDKGKVAFANQHGIAEAVMVGETDVKQRASSFSGGLGMDAVVVASSSRSNEPIIMAGEMARDRATIVNIGINKMDIPWNLYYMKELSLKQSRSYGPGRYDDDYELNGKDYPIGYVRWTENRNMESFLKLVGDGKIDVARLITHRFDFDDAVSAFNLITGKSEELYIGIILDYNADDASLKKAMVTDISLSDAKPAGGMKIGLIGAGNFARTMLLPYIQGKRNVNLVNVATSTGITAKDTARKFGFGKCTTDYKELLNDESINTVMVVTRHNLHGKMVAEALRAGKNVYVEKPLAMNISELEEVKAAWHERKESQKLFAGFNRRFAPMVGDMKSFFVGRNEPMIMHYRMNAGFKYKTDWYNNPEIGGGRIIGEVCHLIDTFNYFTGSLPVSLFAQTIKTGNSAITLADNINVSIQLGEGSIGSIIYAANGDPGFPKEYIEIFCENKVAVLDNFTSLTTMARGKLKKSKPLTQEKGHKAEMAAFIGSVRDGDAMPISFESLYATTLATFKIHESIGSKAPVDL